MFQEIYLTVTGAKEIYIENYKNLIDYKPEQIVVKGKSEQIAIHGNDFLIDYFANDGMKIKGNVTCIEFHVISSKKQAGR